MSPTLRSLLVVLAASVPAAPARAQAPVPAASPQIGVVVDPPAGEVGVVMGITLSVSGEAGADCALLEVPEVEGARLQLVQNAAVQQRTVIVNGRVERSMRTEWRVQVIPEVAGTLEIPPFRLNCSGQELQSRALSVEVTSGGVASDEVQLAVTASTDTLWAGQIFSLQVTGSMPEKRIESGELVPNGLELDLPWLDGVPGLLRLDTPPPAGQTARVRLTGQRDTLEMSISHDVRAERYLFSRTIDMLATAPGTIELPAARFSATLALETRRSRDPFSFLGDHLVVTKWRVLDGRAPGPVLTIRGAPEEGRPSSYTNAVGRFRFTGTAGPTTLRVGDTCTLTLSFTGEGNLEFVEWPPFDELAPDFRVFGKTERKLARTRVLEIQVSPKNDRVTRVPALEFSAFDPEQGTYERLSVGPFELTVTPGGQDGLANLESPSDTLSSLETIREALPAPAGRALPAWFWPLPGVLALLAVELSVRRRRWLAGHPREIARRRARRRLDTVLGSAAEVRDIAQAFGKFLSSRLDGPPAGMTAQEAAERLADEELAVELRRVMGGWEASYLGGLRHDVATARTEAARLADRVEAAT